MSLTITYKNECGTVVMQGGGKQSPLRVTAIDGLGLLTKEYTVATYTGYDGQETISSRATARSITLAVELYSSNAPKIMRDILMIFNREGYLYIQNEDIDRRIKCNQVQCPDASRVLKGQLATFAVQFVCDNPYFEDSVNTSIPIYKRVKLLQSPFTLDTMFGDIIKGATIQILGSVPVEPVISLYYPSAQDSAESIIVKNETTGAEINLTYSPKENDMITIDIKNRKVTSAISGNLINCLSLDTFLGDFVLVAGLNTLSVNMGDVDAKFTIECQYNNLYSEAVIV